MGTYFTYMTDYDGNFVDIIPDELLIQVKRTFKNVFMPYPCVLVFDGHKHAPATFAKLIMDSSIKGVAWLQPQDISGLITDPMNERERQKVKWMTEHQKKVLMTTLETL